MAPMHPSDKVIYCQNRSKLVGFGLFYNDLKYLGEYLLSSECLTGEIRIKLALKKYSELSLSEKTKEGQAASCPHHHIVIL